MGKKVVAMFVMCMVVVAAMHISKAKADDAKYKECFSNCKNECKEGGGGEYYCEMKCADDCDAKQKAEDLGIKLGD